MRSLVFASIVCCLGWSALAQNNGWDFTALSGAITRSDAQLLALSASFVNGSDPRLPVWWANFKTTFYKKYANNASEATAYANFLTNINNIYSTNSDINIKYWLSGNYYADFDYESFRKHYLMTNITLTNSTHKGRMLTSPVDEPPSLHELAARRRLQGSSVDWRQTGQLSPIADQGQCGSCWAYAATGSIEAAYNIYMQTTASQSQISLSEQQIIDCAGVGTCNGGGTGGAIDYVHTMYQATASYYPPTYTDGSCYAPSQAPSDQAVQLSSGCNFPTTGSESILMQAVAQQPTAFYFEVVSDFYQYSGGIYQPTSCGTSVNHAMVAVGYYYTGDPSSSYWIIRNSWGAGWGQNGYMYVQMTGTSSGPCGMYTNLFQPPLNFDLTLSNPPPTSSPPPPGTPDSPPPSTPDYSPPPPSTPDYSPPPPSTPDYSPPPPSTPDYSPPPPSSPAYVVPAPGSPPPESPSSPSPPPPRRRFRRRPSPRGWNGK